MIKLNHNINGAITGYICAYQNVKEIKKCSRFTKETGVKTYIARPEKYTIRLKVRRVRCIERPFIHMHTGFVDHD